MIQFEKFILPNGLTVLVHEDHSTPLVAMNILYNVGARDEDPSKTGFAHLFEHLMFGGSINIPSYDEPLQKAGGENNAFTSNDFTNYYLTIPAANIETAFWLESDRMLNLAFSPKSLQVQKQVVIEEFKQRYLNQPYGDVWLQMRPLAYKVHPYRWPTIGMDISHIENATMDDVKSFFKSFYHPANAIMCIAGNTNTDQVMMLCNKWFAPIPGGQKVVRHLPQEPVQTARRQLELERNVPVKSIYKAWHCCARTDKEFYCTDLITDIMSHGKSTRLYNGLVKQKRAFSSAQMYLLGEMDKSLIFFEGKVSADTSFEEAEAILNNELNKLINDKPEPEELDKVKRQIETTYGFANRTMANKALNLCYFELMGDAGFMNTEIENYMSVSAEAISETASKLFNDNNASVMYYQPSVNS